MALDNLDFLILGLYLVGIVSLGLLVSRGQKNSADYFLAGRSLGWVIIGFSLFASNISSTTLIGLAGAGYYTGVSISAYEWMAAVVLVFFALFLLPSYLSARVYTVPEFLERRFNVTCRYYFSALTIAGNVLIDTAGTLYAGSLVVKLFFPEVELWVAALALALVAGVYTASGGLAAVVYTDVVQAIVLLIGACLVTWLLLHEVGSWESAVAATPPEMLSMIRPLDDPTMPWLGLVIGVPILGFYFWCTNQFIVQRVLAARDLDQARWGALFAGLLKIPVLFVMVFPGLMARLVYPDLPRPDLVFPTLIDELLPVGIKGLVLAGLLAAIMSSIDSTLNSASTLVTMDFVKRLRPAVSERTLVIVGRLTTVGIMLFSALWVPVVARATTLFEYLQSSLAFLFPPVVAIVLLGLFSRRVTGTGAFAGLVVGHVTALATFVLTQVYAVSSVHFLILAGGFLLVSGLATMAVSLVTAPPGARRVQELIWSKSRLAPLRRTRWYQDYRFQAVALLALAAWIVWAYR